MKILYAASEALPFAASGGLADVAGSLPKAIRNKEICNQFYRLLILAQSLLRRV